MGPMRHLLGLRTVIYPAPDLAASKAWFTAALGVEPYFDEPFYVGFDVGGYELGLVPAADGPGAPVTYWGVANAEVAVQQLMASGATAGDPVTDVGGDPRRDGDRAGRIHVRRDGESELQTAA